MFTRSLWRCPLTLCLCLCHLKYNSHFSERITGCRPKVCKHSNQGILPFLWGWLANLVGNAFLHSLIAPQYPLCILIIYPKIRFLSKSLFIRWTGSSSAWTISIICSTPCRSAAALVLDTFENSSAERVPSECNQSRYIADISKKDISRASPDILPIYFTKICFKTLKTCGSK